MMYKANLICKASVLLTEEEKSALVQDIGYKAREDGEVVVLEGEINKSFFDNLTYRDQLEMEEIILPEDGISEQEEEVQCWLVQQIEENRVERYLILENKTSEEATDFVNSVLYEYMTSIGIGEMYENNEGGEWDKAFSFYQDGWVQAYCYERGVNMDFYALPLHFRKE